MMPCITIQCWLHKKVNDIKLFLWSGIDNVIFLTWNFIELLTEPT